MNRSEHQVAGFGGVDRRHEGLFVTQFADQNDIGVFTHRVLHADSKVPGGRHTLQQVLRYGFAVAVFGKAGNGIVHVIDKVMLPE